MMRNFIFITCLIGCTHVLAESQADLAKDLNNPVKDLINVPIDYIVDENIGPADEGKVTLLKFSPVIPFSLNDEWNIVSRTIFAYADQDDIPVSGQGKSGLTDIAESVFFSPKAPTKSGLIWGVGGVFLLDTATDDQLGSGKWGMGPTAVALRQDGPWTYGALTHYLTDVAGDDDRPDIEEIFLQPFISYTIDSTKTTFTLQSEATRNLESNETSANVFFLAGQMFKVGSQIMQFNVGVRHWYESTDFSPEGTSFTARLVLLFPK